MNKKIRWQLVPAKLVSLRLECPPNFENGAAFKFRETDENGGNEGYNYYGKDVCSKDSGTSLKRVCYFLDYPLEIGKHYNFRRLVGRECLLEIEMTNLNGRIFPRITGFRFSPNQIYRWSGDSNSDNHSGKESAK